mmetsp:Transcript_8936/g.14896  ORF Transcript_8936/g.14896 Transcript_8936/m.14896 type:complete len:213 (+) Transcript_8936:594-1232(+)
MVKKKSCMIYSLIWLPHRNDHWYLIFDAFKRRAAIAATRIRIIVRTTAATAIILLVLKHLPANRQSLRLLKNEKRLARRWKSQSNERLNQLQTATSISMSPMCHYLKKHDELSKLPKEENRNCQRNLDIIHTKPTNRQLGKHGMRQQLPNMVPWMPREESLLLFQKWHLPKRLLWLTMFRMSVPPSNKPLKHASRRMIIQSWRPVLAFCANW